MSLAAGIVHLVLGRCSADQIVDEHATAAQVVYVALGHKHGAVFLCMGTREVGLKLPSI